MKRNRKRKKLNNIMIISVCAVLLLMTAGYAAMQTSLGINAKGNVVKKATGGEALLDNVDIVTEGDGLYVDSYEENVYTYRGANPNNYVTFNGEQWRIISVNTSDNTIKIMRNAVLSDRQFDTESGRYQGRSGYCNSSSWGCNIWGSNSTLYDINLSPITTLAYQVGGTAYALPSKEAELNTYLNTTYYNGLNATARSMIKNDAVYKAGVLLRTSGQTTSTDISQVSATKWKGKVALIDATNSSCTGAEAYYSNSSCYSGGGNNWMYISDNYWTMSPLSAGSSNNVWAVRSSGTLYYTNASYSNGVRPVVTLSSNIQITGGAGTSSNPYTLGI